MVVERWLFAGEVGQSRAELKLKNVKKIREILPGVRIDTTKEGYKAAYNTNRGKKVEKFESCSGCGASRLIGQKCPACGVEDGSS